MVEVIDSKKIAICSINEIALLEKNEKNLFEECYTIKLGNMLINKIKYKNNMIFAYGRTKRNNEYLN